MAGGARQVRRRPRADPVRLSSPGIEHAPRGDRIKALKYNVAADSFTLKTFWARQATLNPVIRGFNRMSLWLRCC